MSTTRTRRRVALVAVLAAAAVGSAAPAQAQADPSPEQCDTRLERLVDRFYEIEERRGYEAATEWWYVRWEKYWERCLAPR